MKRFLCIYHGHCDDGFAAAWCVRDALGDEVEFYPGVYQQEPPDVAGRDVILVDFSYKRPVLEGIIASAKSVLILDHHKTAQEDLGGLGSMVPWHDHEALGGTHVLFDMERSGAGIAWDYFHPGAKRPVFINYIEDRDLWKKHLPEGDEFTIALRSYPQDFDIWNVLLLRGVPALIEQGRTIQRYYRLRVEELKQSAYLAEIGDAGPVEAPTIMVRCAISNAPYFAASEVAGELCSVDGAAFGACYFEAKPGIWQYSLRSRGDFDVSALAKRFGGGGHKNAAGFSVAAPVHTILAESINA